MSESRSPVTVAVGWFLVVLGGLWLLLTGGCSLAVLSASIFSLIKQSQYGGGEQIPMLLFIAAICIAPGVVLLLVGLRMTKGPPAAPAPPHAFD